MKHNMKLNPVPFKMISRVTLRVEKKQSNFVCLMKNVSKSKQGIKLSSPIILREKPWIHWS